MFGIGFQELIVILIVALIVLGPQRLPEAAKTIAKFIREIRGAVDEVKSSVAEDIASVRDITKIDLEDIEVKEKEKKKEIDKEKEEDTFEKEFTEEIKKKEYQPKREKISFKKKSGDDINGEES